MIPGGSLDDSWVCVLFVGKQMLASSIGWCLSRKNGRRLSGVCAAEKLVEFLYTWVEFYQWTEICSEGDTMVRHQLSEEQEREAQVLEAKIRGAVDQEIANLARLLVSKGESDLFGQSEFQIRDLVLRVGAKAFEEHLRGKKTATEVAP